MEKAMNNKFTYLAFSKALTMFAIVFLIAPCKTSMVLTSPWYPETNPNGEAVLAVYESRIPCSDCERLKLALVVYGNTKTNFPSTYTMARVYVGKNNERLTNSGNIKVVQGTSIDPLHTVYLLTSGVPEEYQFFWKIDENLLLILDKNLTPKVGDAGHGYVLNRIR